MDPISPKEYASWGSRVAAFFIDAILTSIPIILLTIFAFVPLFLSQDINGFLAFLIILLSVLVSSLLVVLFYAPLFMMRKGRGNGQTPGHQIMGIRVCRDNGLDMDFQAAFIREVLVKMFLFNILGSLAFGAPLGFLVDNAWPIWDQENQALHDKLVQTHVYRAR